jgi:hypothetical protein
MRSLKVDCNGLNDMPLVENHDLAKFPYHGAFYTYGVDESLPLYEQEEKEIKVFETDCDIQKTSKLHSGTLLVAYYTIYFPLEENPDATGTIDKFKDIPIRRGMTFKGMFYGVEVVGEVEIIRPSQLGACSCDIKVVDEYA